jgi:hypothetical protein
MKEKKVAAETTEVVLSDEVQNIWNQLKDLRTEFFGLKNITIKDVCTPVNLDKSKLFLKLKAPAALISVEGSLSQLVSKNVFGDVVQRFTSEQVRDMVAVSPNPEL